MSLVQQNFAQSARVLAAFSTPENFARIESAAQLMIGQLRVGGRIFSCGNGGSLCDAMHFAEELTGRFRDDRPAIGAVAIADAGHMSCVGNDYGYENVFARYLAGLARPGDVLLAISTSGNSANVVRAAEQARQMGMAVVGLTGNTGGKLAPLCTIEIRVPHNGYADRIQELHIQIIHSLVQLIESDPAVFGDPAK